MKQINGTTRLTGLLGSPVAHSISPLMHNEAFRLLGLDYVYLCFDVREEALETAVRGLMACHVRGFNVTMPDKTRMVSLVDTLSPAARLIGAVNTVVCENGRMTGHNTDGVGCMRALKEGGYEISGSEITLFGGGGTACAITVQAALDGARLIHVFIRPTSRFYNHMCSLARDVTSATPCEVLIHDLAREDEVAACLENSSLLLNATSVGMAPNEDDSLIRYPGWLHPDLTVYDVIYNPRQTRLLQQAQAAGCKTMNGLYMLLYQGAEAFRLWTDQEMPVEPIQKLYFDV